MIRRAVLFLFALLLTVSAYAAPVSIVGTLKNSTNTSAVPNGRLYFTLYGCSGVPTNTEDQSTPPTVTVAQANGFGVLSGTIVASDVISCDGVTTSNYYSATAYDAAGKFLWERKYRVASGPSWNVNTAQQMASVPTGGGTGGTSGVSSFKGRAGAVVPASGDYSAAMITDLDTLLAGKLDASAKSGVGTLWLSIDSGETDGCLTLSSGKATSLGAPCGAGGGGGAWGSITGTLSTQTDLQNALNAKVPTTRQVNGHALTGDVVVTQTDVGLGSVNNTSDINKPISTATQTALNAKANLSHNHAESEVLNLATDLAGKEPANANIQAHVTAAGNPHGTTAAQVGAVPTTRMVNSKALSADITLTKADVGLANVDNTSDASKPISTLTQAALDLKVPTSRAINGHPLSGDFSISASDVGLGSVNNVAQMPLSYLTTDNTFTGALDTKVASQAAVKAYVDAGLNVKLNSSGFNLTSVVALWTNCTVGYLKFDGNCDVPSAGGVTWGNISGDITTQPDLNTALTNRVLKTTTINTKALSGNITLVASDLGLGNVTNVAQMPLSYLSTITTLGTSDVLVPSQNAVKVYADTKVPSTRTVAGKALSSDVTLVAGDVGLSNVTNVAQMPSSYLMTDSTFATNTDNVHVPSALAVKTYADTKLASSALTSALIIGKFNSCSGYLKSDGNCSLASLSESGGNLTATGKMTATSFEVSNGSATDAAINIDMAATPTTNLANGDEYERLGVYYDYINSGFVARLHTSDIATSTSLGTSDAVIPSQNAVKVYADTKLPLTYLDADGALATNSDSKIASQKATKTYADTKLASSALTASLIVSKFASGVCSGYLKSDSTCDSGAGGSMVYPGAGIPQSTGAAWGTSLVFSTTTALGTSDTTIPSQNAVKTYVDATKVRSCVIPMGDGVNAITAGTYPLNAECLNQFGSTFTITSVKCYADAGSGSSCAASTSHSGTPQILSPSTVTATASYAAGTLNGTPTLLSTEWLNASIVADGTAKTILMVVTGTI